jgi:hypothetical protein
MRGRCSACSTELDRQSKGLATGLSGFICKIGIEPPNLSAGMPRRDRSHSTSHTSHVA